MTPFLKLVADDVFSRFNGHLENIAVVFPNKRAGLFFNKYLLKNSGNTPMWSPRYMTINELFQQNSDLTAGDPILLVSKLYKEYIRPKRENESWEEYEKSIESIDSFYYWSEMLIKDFDDIDKHLVNAAQLFSNIKDLKEMGTAKDILDKEQAESIARFFKNFNPENKSEAKQKFLDLWERLYSIYTNFKETLRRERIAYEGMLFRDVIENEEKIVLKHNKYIFVGFNALNDVEKKMFHIVKKAGKALFYWDYDTYYTSNAAHEAGLFMRMNLKDFPNELVNENFSNLCGKKKVRVIDSSNDSIQARYLSTWLSQNMTEDEVETAVILCDETMLEPVLHTIPPEINGRTIEQMNVTMGFPVSQTPIFTLSKLLVDLQTRCWSEKHKSFTHTIVNEILCHPYVKRCSANATALHKELLDNKVFFPDEAMLCKDEFLSGIFRRITGTKEWFTAIGNTIKAIGNSFSSSPREKMKMYEKLFCEAIYKAYTQVQRIICLLDSGELTMKQTTIGRLFTKAISMMSMPFHGEPLIGLQIMGLLETRNLDFKNIILLGVNEGNLPKKSSENSYIPYNLRRAFGLTLSEHRDSIYAYYFYRLMQRAENITLVYNSSSDSKTRGECSRYILQLLGSNIYEIERCTLGAHQNNSTFENKGVEKTPDVMERLCSRFTGTDKYGNTRYITPSAINKYLRCGLSFFYYYVLGIKKPDEVSEEVQNYDFGNIFHYAAELLYGELSQKGKGTITKTALEYYIQNEALLFDYIDKSFKKNFFKDGRVEYNGEQFINRGVLHHFLLHTLKLDYEYAPFTYIGSEIEIKVPYTVKRKEGDVNTCIGGKIDRIDAKGNTLNILDYKTGSTHNETKTSLDDLFAHNILSAGNRIQAFLYSSLIDDMIKEDITEDTPEWLRRTVECGAKEIAPSLLYVSNSSKEKREDFIIDVLKKPVTDITAIKEEYLVRLKAVLEEIFDSSLQFTPTDDEDKCEKCEYRALCRK